MSAGRSAIVCLTRGYPDLRGYDPLIKRNRSIYETINRRRRIQYPLIIWHEGNIPPEHQLYIRARERNRDIRFVDVSMTFELPGDAEEWDLAESWSLGYRLMCRFHSYYIWRYVAQFDYILRLDEDCTLTSVVFDPIEGLADAGGDFATVLYVPEMHKLTNRTLAPFVRKFAAALHPGIARSALYNQSFPYTNFYVTRTAFWNQPAVQRFLYAAIYNRNFVRYRWGDLPVLGVALNMFASPQKVYRISKVGYRHASHGFQAEPEE